MGRKGSSHKVLIGHFLSPPYDCPQSLHNHDAIINTLAKDAHALCFAIYNFDRKRWGCCRDDRSWELWIRHLPALMTCQNGPVPSEDVRARNWTVHVWTSKLVCLCVSSLSYNMLLASVIRSLFSLITAIDCTKPEAAHVLGYYLGVSCRFLPSPDLHPLSSLQNTDIPKLQPRSVVLGAL